MILYEFDYEQPETLEEAVVQLRALGSSAAIAAGGTDLLPNMRIEVVRPSTVVSLGAIEPVAPARQADGAIRIDALTRLAAIEESALLREALPMLVQAASVVGSNQIRQMGTLGGNLCQDTRCLWFNQKHDYQFKVPCYKRGGDLCYPFPTNRPGVCWSVHMSDTAPALMALNAQVDILGESGVRRIDLENLYTGDGITPVDLTEGEIIAAIIVAPPAQRTGWGYCKSARRGGLEFGISVMAVSVTADDDGRCSAARIFVNAIRERPIRLVQTEQALQGASLDEATEARIAAVAAKEINPLPHHGFTKSHIRDDFRIKIRRALGAAFARTRDNVH